MSLDYTTCREIRSLDMMHQFLNRNIRIVNIGANGITTLGKIVWSHICSHSDCNT